MSTPLRLLLVEDSEDDGLLLLRSLRHLDQPLVHLRVETEDEMEDALRTQSWDFVIADYVLPSFSGLAALDVLRHAGIDVPFIMVSGKASEETAVEAMKAGAHDYIAKGNLTRLVPAIRRELREAAVRRERKKAEEAFLRTEKKFLTVFNAALDGIFFHDASGRVLDVNPSAAARLGYHRDELIGKTATEFTSVEHGRKLEERFATVFERGEAVFESVHEHRDGASIHVEVSARVIDYDGEPGVLAVVRDITERKAAEDKLRLAAQVFEHSLEGVMITDANRRIVSVNSAFTTITGYAASSVVGKTPQVLSSGRNDQAFYEAMWSEIAASGSWRGEIVNRRADGLEYSEHLTIVAVRADGERVINYIGFFSDITERKAAEKRIAELAHFDPLTKLPNRSLLADRLNVALASAKRNRTQLGLLFVDLDYFKNINDTFGHETGDKVLKTMAERVGRCVRGSDTVARFGGDEFVVILGDLSSRAGAAEVARKLLDEIGRPCAVEDTEVHLSASIGVALYPSDGATAEDLIRCADMAMYRSKEDGRSSFRFFRDEGEAETVDRETLETALRHAIDAGELRLHFQPRFELVSHRIVAVEALVRWAHPTLGLLLPSHFLNIAEESGLILPLGAWVLREALGTLRRWLDAGASRVRVAINLSSRELTRRSLPEFARRALDDFAIDPRLLELDVTEAGLLRDPRESLGTLQALGKLGIRLHLDDYGTGSSSLLTLRRFPIDAVKIDRSLVGAIPFDDERASIAQAIISLAKGTGRRVIAEGVETARQLEFLHFHRCDEAQGFFLGLDLPPDDALALLR